MTKTDIEEAKKDVDRKREVRKVLEGAVADWESGRLGWCQGRLYSCRDIEVFEASSLGMVNYQLLQRKHDIFSPAGKEFRDEIVGLVARRFGTIDDNIRGYLSAWNDDPTRTKADVLELFSNAVTQAKKDESVAINRLDNMTTHSSKIYVTKPAKGRPGAGSPTDEF